MPPAPSSGSRPGPRRDSGGGAAPASRLRLRPPRAALSPRCPARSALLPARSLVRPPGPPLHRSGSRRRRLHSSSLACSLCAALAALPPPPPAPPAPAPSRCRPLSGRPEPAGAPSLRFTPILLSPSLLRIVVSCTPRSQPAGPRWCGLGVELFLVPTVPPVPLALPQQVRRDEN